MKGRALIVFVVSVLALSALGCVCGGIDFGTVRFGGATEVRGSGNVVEELRQVSGFRGVELAGFGDLTIEVGEREEVRIEAEDNLLEYIETEARGGMLRIQTREGVSLRNRQPIRYYLTAKELEEIVISGSGDIQAPDLEARQFSVTISGSGDLRLGDLAADALRVKINGSGDIQLEDLRAETLDLSIAGSGNLDIRGGEIEKQVITISGSGDYQARDLESAEAQIRIPGSGTVAVRVRDHLEVNISGSGDVRYVGNPALETDVSGSGNIKRIGQ